MPPTNQEIADLFENMATLLEIKGGAIFKIHAYQNAASTISHLSFSLEEAVQDGMDLKSIPGIGDAISQKIHEMCSTGEVGAYERLKEELPNGVLNLMSVPGIGPKTALLIAQELGASTIDELEQAALDGRLATLPGMGEKTVQNILAPNPVPAHQRPKGDTLTWSGRDPRAQRDADDRETPVARSPLGATWRRSST